MKASIGPPFLVDVCFPDDSGELLAFERFHDARAVYEACRELGVEGWPHAELIDGSDGRVLLSSERDTPPAYADVALGAGPWLWPEPDPEDGLRVRPAGRTRVAAETLAQLTKLTIARGYGHLVGPLTAVGSGELNTPKRRPRGYVDKRAEKLLPVIRISEALGRHIGAVASAGGHNDPHFVYQKILTANPASPSKLYERSSGGVPSGLALVRPVSRDLFVIRPARAASSSF